MGLNSVPLKRLELHLKARKREGYLELLECMSRGEGGYHIKCGGLYQVPWTPGLRQRLQLGLPVTPQTKVGEVSHCMSDLCGQFYKVHYKSPDSLLFTPKTVSPKMQPEVNSPSRLYLWFWENPSWRHPAAAAAANSLQCPTLCDSIDGSPPGSPVPGDSPGKNTGVDCHFLLQCMKVKSESDVAQSQPHGLQPTRFLHPQDFPVKSTGVGCHCLLRRHPRITPNYQSSFSKGMDNPSEWVITTNYWHILSWSPNNAGVRAPTSSSVKNPLISL